MTACFKAACIQLNAGPEIGPNLDKLEAMIRQAANDGADFVLTPETSDLIEPDGKSLRLKILPEVEHPGPPRIAGLAAELQCWILIGSFLVISADGRPANRSLLFAPDGGVRARYDKIHMFDVDIPDGQRYRESRRFNAGNRAVLPSLPWGLVGLTICYDLRFPSLYRFLAEAGAMFLTVPSAFTRLTGEAHWHTLLRARAIETGSYVLAPAQCGRHARGRETFGHSLMVSPWGEVIADGGDGPGYVVAEIDASKVAAARRAIPSLRGGRTFNQPTLPA
jgi:predicted amidohydrolase